MTSWDGSLKRSSSIRMMRMDEMTSTPRMQLNSVVMQSLEAFETDLRRRNIHGSFLVARRTALLLRDAVSRKGWNTAADLMYVLKHIGLRLTACDPMELVIGNIVRRVLYFVREEYVTAKVLEKEAPTPQRQPETHFQRPPLLTSESRSSGLYILLEEDADVVEDYTRSLNIKGNVIESIHELLDELDSVYLEVSKQAIQHIHANEIILTCGASSTVEAFLQSAARKRTFSVMVAEGAPLLSGHRMAKRLAKAGIQVTLISDAAVFAVMARVNKVIVGTHAVVANGGLVAQAGMMGLALAAKEHSVPFVVCTGLYKLCSLFPHDDDTFQDIGSPQATLTFEEADVSTANPIMVCNPSFSYVPPDLVHLFVTNVGSHHPMYVYRLLSEYYAPEDSNTSSVL